MPVARKIRRRIVYIKQIGKNTLSYSNAGVNDRPAHEHVLLFVSDEGADHEQQPQLAQPDVREARPAAPPPGVPQDRHPGLHLGAAQVSRHILAGQVHQAQGLPGGGRRHVAKDRRPQLAAPGLAGERHPLLAPPLLSPLHRPSPSSSSPPPPLHDLAQAAIPRVCLGPRPISRTHSSALIHRPLRKASGQPVDSTTFLSVESNENNECNEHKASLIELDVNRMDLS
jgi:hypothetical protein